MDDKVDDKGCRRAGWPSGYFSRTAVPRPVNIGDSDFRPVPPAVLGRTSRTKWALVGELRVDGQREVEGRMSSVGTCSKMLLPATGGIQGATVQQIKKQALFAGVP